VPEASAQIVLITTGGTIGEVSQVGFNHRHLPGEQLLHAISVPDRVRVSIIDLLDLPSTFMTFAHMLQVVRAIETATAGGADGVVITHGTDTIEETAYFVDLVTAKGRPIVFTGAMLPPELPGADGPLNLHNALLVASAAEARGRGVLVTFAGEIHAAREVTKAHSMSVAAFKSPEFGPLGTVDERRVAFARWTPPSETIPLAAVTARVEGVKCYAAMSDVTLRALIAAGFDGVVLETLGSGQVPPQLMPAIRDAIRAGAVVVAATRCPAGRLIREHYGLPIRVDGDERDLLDAGVIFSDLQGPKARIKLAVALSAGLQREEVRQLFEPTRDVRA